MKDKKILAYKNERIKRIAFNLRGVIRDVIMDEWSRLGNEQQKIYSETNKIKVTPFSDFQAIYRLKNEATVKCMNIEDDRSDLYRALNNSICICPGCNQTDRDMYYNAFAECWFCTLCVQEYRDFYHKNKAVLDRGGFVGDFDEDFHGSFL